MTNAERLDALFGYKKPDHMPIGTLNIVEFSARNFGYPKILNYTAPEKSFFSQIWTAEQYGWDNIYLRMGSPILFGSLDFGGEVQLPETDYQQGISVKSYPVKTEDDIAKLKLPDRKTAGFIPKAKEFARLQERHGMPIWFSVRSPFTMGANICELNQFCRWMVRQPELCHELIKLALAHILDVLDDWVDTFGTEKLIAYMASPSESNQVISPKQFEKFALPYHAQFHDRLMAMGIKRFMFHICGEQNMNLPSLANFSAWPHPSILSFGHEVDIEVAAKYFPQDIIYGNIAPTVMQTGSPQQVYDLCRVAIDKGKKLQGGFILAPGCSLSDLTPPVNVFALTRAVNDLGWYE